MILALQARDVGREYLDQPTLDAVELHRNLREMAMLNRLPGGVEASRRAIEWLLDGRVARRGVVVNDLRRGRLAYAATAVTVLGLARGRYTRHDGVLSARRAYTLTELDELAASAGLRRVRRSPAFLPRVVTVYR